MPLPSSLDYRERYESIPEGAKKITVCIPANNGLYFRDGGEELMFDFGETGYLVPNSIRLQFKFSITNGATRSDIIGTPVSAFFSKFETIIDDNKVEIINNFSQTNNLFVNLNYNIAQKYSNQFNFGYRVDTNLTVMNSRVLLINATATGALSMFIPCLLSNCDKYLPLWAMPKIRIILTTENINNMLTTTTTVEGIIISNPELVYECIDLGQEYDKVVKAKEKIYINSQSFSNSSVSVPLGNGNRVINFSHNFSNVRCAFVLFGSLVTALKLTESVDITNTSGSYSLTIGNRQFPQSEYSTLLNKGGIIMELVKCVNAIFGNGENMSIMNTEFNRVDNVFVPATSIDTPGKFYLPFLFECVNMSGRKEGISLKDQIISVNINQSIAQVTHRICSLILVYKSTIEIDIKNRRVNVRS